MPIVSQIVRRVVESAEKACWGEDKELGFTRKTTSESETDATVPWDRLDALCPES